MSPVPELLPCVEIAPPQRAERAVIWLHGLGADGNDFAPIVPMLGLDDLAIRFVLPHAPVMPVTLNGGMRMRAWFDIAQIGADDFDFDADGVRRSAELVAALVERELERGIPAERIALAGFSQGGAIALYLGLSSRERLAGIVALSTDLVLADELAAHSMPIFLAHGTADPIVSFARGERTRQRLVSAGHEVEWHAYPMQHEVCIEEIAAIGVWLRRVLAA